MAECRLPVDAGIVYPHTRDALFESSLQLVAPGAAVGEVDALRGAAADGDDGQVGGEIARWIGAAKTERVLRMDDDRIDLRTAFMRDAIDLLDRQHDLVAAHAKHDRVEDAEG